MGPCNLFDFLYVFDEGSFQDQMVIMVTSKNYWEEYGCLADSGVHAGVKCQTLIDLDAGEVAEAHWCLPYPNTEEGRSQARGYLNDNGFAESQAMKEFLDSCN